MPAETSDPEIAAWLAAAHALIGIGLHLGLLEQAAENTYHSSDILLDFLADQPNDDQAILACLYGLPFPQSADESSTPVNAADPAKNVTHRPFRDNLPDQSSADPTPLEMDTLGRGDRS